MPMLPSNSKIWRSYLIESDRSDRQWRR